MVEKHNEKTSALNGVKVLGMLKYKSLMFVRSFCKCFLVNFSVSFKMRLIIKWEGDLQDIPFGTGDVQNP